MVFKSEFYGGSRVLTPLADKVGMPIDQINFLACQLVALGLAFPFRSVCCVEKVSTKTRHIIEAGVGMLLTVFCFGYQIWHLLVQSLVSYAVMAYGGRRFSHALVFGWSMFYLSICHIYRQVYDYGGYTLDITGPLMIQTQKLTSLAFALHDGRYKDQTQLSKDQKQHAVSKLPSILQYLSYMFYFHGIMVGPVTFYNDYIAFIDGTNYIKPGGNAAASGSRKHPAENLNRVVIKKLLVASACCAGMMILPGLAFPPEKLNTPEYYNMTFLERMIFILGVLTIAKHKYYFAWILGDALNNAAGLGFSGYDAQGNPKWDLTDNVDIWGVEFSKSLKVNVDSWNKTTLIWLRRVVYDRSPYNQTIAVFMTSAFWHGFYPAYYVTFGGGAFMTIVARQVRRKIRPHFQSSPQMIFLYDAITFTFSRLANCYLAMPFLLLEFHACYLMYKSLYFYLHILAALALVVLKFVPTPRQAKPAAPRSDTQAAPVSASTDGTEPKPLATTTTAVTTGTPTEGSCVTHRAVNGSVTATDLPPPAEGEGVKAWSEEMGSLVDHEQGSTAVEENGAEEIFPPKIDMHTKNE